MVQNHIACLMGIQRIKSGSGESPTGGWCRISSLEDGGQHRTDLKLVSELAEFFQGKRVASFGDGPGRYKQLLTDSGKLSVYDAYDGAPFGETTSEGRVKYMDLTLPQFGLPLYDWVMSLEVAEHIPGRFESVYLDNIVRHAKAGIVLSWAIPGQTGHSHVNNRSPEYVINLFDGLGFTLDLEASKRLRGASKFSYFRRNLNVFRRRDQTHMDTLIYA